ncbi:hypothetical protein DASC09_015130 [Saccharomycopsis crataegensis]|uniref:Uncharacterized protein n=1 Tax=Saccharomycopsis crataegensis TaxID=43959 RepID=A0AAV5QH56_9ASCO|nr:hypothetical protein DASC09_015130 [Saccharomycopsis crataegensis]
MGIIKKTLFGATCGAVGYGYYLSKQYESIPFYQIPRQMEINNIVNNYKTNPDEFFAYCNTYSSKIRLDPKKLTTAQPGKFHTEKDVINEILVKFLNNGFYQLQLPKEVELKDLDTTENNFSIYTHKPNSVVVKVEIPTMIVNNVEKLSDWGLPYRTNSTSYQEIYVELKPEVNEKTQINETYSAEVFFSSADLYNKHNFDGKILPRVLLSVNRFYNRLLLKAGVDSISESLGME